MAGDGAGRPADQGRHDPGLPRRRPQCRRAVPGFLLLPSSGKQVHDGGWSGFFGVDDGDAGFPSPYFGFQIVCDASPCTSNGDNFLVQQLQLDVEETAGPTLTAGGLWGQQTWVRGDWPLSVDGDSPSGVCELSAAVDGQVVASQSFPQDTAAWHQCTAAGAGGAHVTVHTSQFSNGAHQLTAVGSDAAQLTTGSSYATTIHVDNSSPSVSLSGPVNAPSTAGTQHVTATAEGSPSGIADIICSVDGSPGHTFSGANAQVPVSGIGQHTVNCYANDNAVDATSLHGRSPAASWSLKIGQPTEMAIAFDKLVGLTCQRTAARVRVAGHWITVRRHGKRLKIRTHSRTKLERVMRCHPKTVLRRTVVLVRARRDGHVVSLKRTKRVRVAVPPRWVAHTARVVSFGHSTTVDGWLGTSTLTPLAGQAVDILAAPEDGSGAFSHVATVTTSATGAWDAKLPPGPSRIVEAVFNGSPTTESSSSGQVRVVVPARIRIALRPSIVPWGASIRVVGQVLGGYVPANSKLLRLNVGIGRIGHIEGLPDIQASGRFVIVWKFDQGHGILHPWFSVATLPEAAFPYAPGTSRQVTLTLGEPTPRVMVKPHHGRRSAHRRKQ
jgi:hypothetical protein